jgi:hypothetical protein
MHSDSEAEGKGSELKAPGWVDGAERDTWPISSVRVMYVQTEDIICRSASFI